ncbi:hypothetical protein [Nannocystis bainbridge]|uniref:Uncharacterized protein n=1 Tax=Nannocystis bainbridge TaxID=2995303 RepID=A0ABT5E4J9_9BACT|nr:hypothetical protein [Nannocystis bainbridge]MDC0720660.1 hypothetical protein [Nannocystis bainbridge]
MQTSIRVLPTQPQLLVLPTQTPIQNPTSAPVFRVVPATAAAVFWVLLTLLPSLLLRTSCGCQVGGHISEAPRFVKPGPR